MKSKLPLLVLLAALVACAAPKPNSLVILADDQGWGGLIKEQAVNVRRCALRAGRCPPVAVGKDSRGQLENMGYN